MICHGGGESTIAWKARVSELGLRGAGACRPLPLRSVRFGLIVAAVCEEAFVSASAWLVGQASGMPLS